MTDYIFIALSTLGRQAIRRAQSNPEQYNTYYYCDCFNGFPLPSRPCPPVLRHLERSAKAWPAR
jgi:hypothetical protein